MFGRNWRFLLLRLTRGVSVCAGECKQQKTNAEIGRAKDQRGGQGCGHGDEVEPRRERQEQKPDQQKDRSARA